MIKDFDLIICLDSNRLEFINIKDIGYIDISSDKDFIINTHINERYNLPTDLPNTSYIKIGSGKTLVESSDSNKRNII